MIMASVIDPDVLSCEHMEQPGYFDQVLQWFLGIESNGQILVDPDGSLWSDLETRISKLHIKYRQDLLTRYVELCKKKNNRGKVIRCRADACRTSPNQPAIERATRVASAGNADALFVSENCFTSPSTPPIKGPTRLLMEEYLRSDYETKRRRYMERLPPIDQLSLSEFEELIVRATRFSVWLRFFDKQIGKGGMNLSSFRTGIQRILQIWSEHAHFDLQFADIVTVQAKTTYDDDGEFDRCKKEEANRVARLRVQQQLLVPLCERFSFPVRLYVKQDVANDIHARYLQTQSHCFLFERGFDLFKKDGSLHANVVKVDSGSLEKVNQFYRLPDYFKC